MDDPLEQEQPAQAVVPVFDRRVGLRARGQAPRSRDGHGRGLRPRHGAPAPGRGARAQCVRHEENRKG